MAVVPDVFYQGKRYEPGDGYEQFHSRNIRTDWFVVAKGCAEQTLELSLNKIPPDKNFSLMLSVGINYGEIKTMGEVNQARYAGSAKILAMG